MKKRYLMTENGLVDITDRENREIEVRTQIISDEMVPTKHPADGKLYTSKAEFRRTTRAHGCVEIGNETLKPANNNYVGGLASDIGRAIYELSKK